MMRIIVSKPYPDYGSDSVGNLNYIEAAGLSTDAKPSAGLVTGSLFMEVDTGKVYAFDEVGAQWHEIGG